MKTFAILLMVAGSLMAESGVKWETSLAEAQKRAKAEHKLIFMDVYTDWCGWCIKLQKETFPSTEAQAALAKVVPFSARTQFKNGKDAENKFIEQQYRVNAYPTLILLDADGKEVARNSGYLTPGPFAAWIAQGVASKR